ncbi:lysostaphin resistance A-like protein [Winogradskyella sp.]|uniref:CPBP family intramembrane glutamic endopeptidase n=1 Tax=Winogradskyella sp. TaxID=1883156 RepID=UPI0035121B37
MKIKFSQTLYALFLPISFMVILMLLSAIPLPFFNVYDIGGIVITLLALILTYVIIKKQGKTFKDIGLYWESKTPIRFGFGFLIGVVVTVIMLAIAINFSSLEVVYNEDSDILKVLFWVLIFFPLAFMEELIFRGHAFLKLNKTIGLWPAQIIMAILFAWYHDYTGATFFNQLLGPGIWALIFGITAIWTKGLAFPIGLHMAINVVLAFVGQKNGRHAIWNLEYSKDMTIELASETNNVGFIMQICILLIGIALTEYYRRKNQETRKI